MKQSAQPAAAASIVPTRKSIPLREIQSARNKATDEGHRQSIQRILEWMRTDSILTEMLAQDHLRALVANGVTV